MKGIIFVEFIELLDELLGIEDTERLIEACNLPSKGEYTSVGTYPDAEMITLVTKLHEHTKIPVPKLLNTFGRFLFKSFVKRYASMIGDMNSGFDLLKKIDNHIHIEVQKLYPEAVLPAFAYEELSQNKLKLIYKSQRKMPDLAEGLIAATMENFNEDCTITTNIIEPDASWVEFIIEKI